MKVKDKIKRRKQVEKIEAAIAEALWNQPDQLEDLLAGTDDGWEFIREKIIALAGEEGEWAGYPLPVEHATLVVQPKHPKQSLHGSTLGEKKPARTEPADYTFVNSWRDYDRRREVYIWRESDGRIKHATLPACSTGQRAKFIMDTIGASQAWSVRAEFTALGRLKSLVTRTAFRYYVLTGTFIETSPRSKIIYVFRKGRPTLALAPTIRGDDIKMLAALCLHPIGFYEGTYAGSMVPTDDVIAHLLMMRGDERKFWAKANHHDLRSAEAGL